MTPQEKEGGFDIPGLATLNGARAAIAKARQQPQRLRDEGSAREDAQFDRFNR